MGKDFLKNHKTKNPKWKKKKINVIVLNIKGL